MKIPSLIMIFSNADAYMGLPPPKYGPNAIFMKIDYFSRNTKKIIKNYIFGALGAPKNLNICLGRIFLLF
jgi:hypothetical protein